MSDYASWLEHYCGEGYSAADAISFADNGIIPRGEQDCEGPYQEGLTVSELRSQLTGFPSDMRITVPTNPFPVLREIPRTESETDEGYLLLA